MGKQSYKKIRKSKRYSRRRGGKVKEHSDVGFSTLDIFLGGNDKDDVKDLDLAMSDFDLFDEPVQNASTENEFGDMSMISRESEPNLNESLDVLEDDEEIVPENSIPFDEDDWMNLDEGFVNEGDDTDDSYLNETTNESISFGGKKTKKRRNMKKRKTMKKRKSTRTMKRRKYNRKPRNIKTRNIKRIRLGGNIDKWRSADFNPNVAFDKKEIGGRQRRFLKGGQNIGGNCSDPNFSIYNTPMLKLFPYRA